MKLVKRISGVNKNEVTGLKANTSYQFKYYGIWKSRTKSIVTGSFTTDGSACGSAIVTNMEVSGTLLSAFGDSLENVIVRITNATGGALVALDTSDLSGGYFTELPPGTYQAAFSLPPFMDPPPVTLRVISGKPLLVDDIVLSGAFQIGGTVTNLPKRDTLTGAIVTLSAKDGSTAPIKRITDDEGHYTFPAKAGEYLLNVIHEGKSLPAPIAVMVSKSAELPDVILSGGSPIRRLLPSAEAHATSRRTDAKGARISGDPPRRTYRIPGLPE